MIKYAVPGLFENTKLVLNFLHYMRENREYFYDDIEVEAVYGTPQFCIWDGGRAFSEYSYMNKEHLEEVIDAVNNDFGIKARYIFTSCLIDEKYYYDRFGNVALFAANGRNNQVVVADDNFRDYIDKNYSFEFISSTTKCILDKKTLIEEIDKPEYEEICIDYNFNKNIKLLSSLNDEQKKKVEFLVNAICPPGCPHRKNHYYMNSVHHLKYGQKFKMDGCGINEICLHPDMKSNSNNLTYEVIKEKYEPLGFEHFKLEGRTFSPIALLGVLCDYMVKPEYKLLVMSYVGENVC